MTATNTVEISKPTKKLLSGQRRRHIREYLTGYLMIAPSMILIFIFGIFPVGFALYVSLHKWRIKQGDLIGLDNYVKAIDSLAYILIFALALGALVAVFLILRNTYRLASEKNEKPWLLAFPGAIHAVTVIALLRWAVLLLPEILGIADKVKGLERTRDVFLNFMIEALKAETVQPAWRLFLLLFMAGILFGYLFFRLRPGPRNLMYQTKFALAWLSGFTGILLAWFTQKEISKVYAEAVQNGTDPGIWAQIITISGGVLLLVIAWVIWRSAEKQTTMSGFWIRVLATMALLVGGWLLIGEIPMIAASGSKDLWSGLKVTVFFSLGTVPFQLAISLFLSILLFQKLQGSNFFRVVYFLPYVTPAIASAAVFKNIFSNRLTAPVNLLLRNLGLPAQQWLYEPQGIFTLLGTHFGFNVPAWAAGPSLALTVIIIHSIWTYVGYDTVIYLAGLGNIPTELIDAAEVDGANKWQIFRSIIFPLLSPTTYFLSLIAIIGTFKAFNTIWIFRDSLALGTTDTFSLVIFLEFFEKLRYGYASALAFVLFAIILSLTLINNRIQGSRVFYG